MFVGGKYPNKHEISRRNRKPDGYRISQSITFRLFYLLNFVLLSGYAVESEKLLTATASGKQGVPEQVHQQERSEDTLQRLLEKVNRVPLHEDFHFRVTNGQRAEVKRACTAKEYLCFPRPIRHKEAF